jgi:hypothetical protein
MCCNICVTGETLLGKVKNIDTELVLCSEAPAGLSEVRWTRTTVGGPNDFGSSITVHADVVVTAEANEFLSCELCVVVCDDGVRDSKAMDDVCEESHHMLGLDVAEGSDLDALGKFVDGDQQVCEAPRCLL